uniref:ABC-type xenobiotic transporter n=1 Tax=Syphacia muris TaxID=451379 RepID=A0A0N5AV15_9BILA
MLFSKKRKKAENEEKQPEEKAVRASIFDLLRYSSSFDRVLYVIGSIVSVATGCGFPLMSIIIGDMTTTIVNAQTYYDTKNETVADYNWDRFHDDMMTFCLDFVYLGIGMFVAATAQVLTYLVASENTNDRIRRQFFKAVLRQDIEWYDKNQSGTLTTKLFDNLERIKEGTGDKIALLIQFTSQFFAGLVIALTYDWRLTLIMMSLSPFMILCGIFIANVMAKTTADESKNYAVAGAIAEEVLTSIRTVLSFNAQEYEYQRYSNALKKSMKDGIFKQVFVGLGTGFTLLIIFCSYALAFWIGTNYVANGSIESGTLLTVFFGVMMGSMALGNAGSQFAVIGAALGAAGTMFEIINRKPEIDVFDEDGEKPQNTAGKIEFKNVMFSYPTRPEIQVLKGVSFTANPGETVAIVGSSGCGKSTTVSLLLRYYNPGSGEISIDGRNIKNINIHHLRNMIGIVSQEPILFNTTIEDNIGIGIDSISKERIIAASRNANAENFISSLPEKYKTLVGDRGTQLSGGQKQRTAIARVLVRNPKILLLDEATSALDAESESIVQQALERAAEGRTTIIIAHRLSTIKNADKIIVMKEGNIVEMGKHSDLLARKGFYYELVQAQVFTDIDDPNVIKEKPENEKQFRRESTVRSRRSRLSSIASAASFGNTVDNANLGPPEQADVKKETERLKKEIDEEGATQSNLFAIMRYARPELLFIFVALLASIIRGCIFPIFSLVDTDEMKRKGHFWALMFLVLGGVMFVSIFMQVFLLGISSERLCRRLRLLLFRRVMSMHIGYFDMPKHSSGKISTRLATDVPNVKTAVDFRLGDVLSGAVALAFGIGIAFYYSWALALLVIAIFPLCGVGQALQQKYMQSRHGKDAKDLENSGKIALEAIESIRTVHALNLHERFDRLFCHYLDGPHKTATQRAIIQASKIFCACAYRFGLFLVVNGSLAPINVMRVITAIAMSATSIGYASAYFPEYTKAKLAAGIIFKMLQTKSEIDNFSNDGRNTRIDGNISFNKLKFAYPERPTVQILNDLNLEVGVGKTLAIVGPSGCGKSTVISLLERFYDPQKGSVIVDGENIQEINLRHLRSQIALVSQEPVLFDCSIKDNIVYGMEPGFVNDQQIFEVAKQANIHKFISSLPCGYDTKVGDKGTQLSGGQKQRIAIARALIRNPKILLLDEATSALDTESEQIVQEALDRAREGRTCIIIAHRLSTVVNVDCIAVIKNGVVQEKGTHAELIEKKGIYYNLTLKQNLKTSDDNKTSEL